MKELTPEQHIELRKWIYKGDYTKRANVFYAFVELHDGNLTKALRYIEKAIGDNDTGEGTIWAKG